MNKQVSDDPSNILQTTIDDLTHEGMGVGRVDGKVYFIPGSLTGETVDFKPIKKKRQYGQGELVKIHNFSPDRVKADCEFFDQCGGCSLQHVSEKHQIQVKHNYLAETLRRIGKVQPKEYLEPLTADWWHYRRKARLGVKYVPKKGGVLVGFREKNGGYIAQMSYCLTLTKKVSDLIPLLAELINDFSIKDAIPQIEVADADNALALVVRHLKPFEQVDLDKLSAFAKEHQLDLYLQSKGPNTVKALYPEKPQALYYELKKYQLKLFFKPSDFIQVNALANEKLIDLALEFLQPNKEDLVLDLFSGLGNFTLPIAKFVDRVIAVDMDSALIEAANENARYNQLDNAHFIKQDLSDENADYSWLEQNYNKVVLDPSRAGALTMVNKIIQSKKAEKIIYVSCNPATLARDSDVLVNKGGYKLTHAGIVNMFPHTAHVEAIAVFER